MICLSSRGGLVVERLLHKKFIGMDLISVKFCRTLRLQTNLSYVSKTLQITGFIRFSWVTDMQISVTIRKSSLTADIYRGSPILAFMYSPVSLLSVIYPLPAMLSLLVKLYVRNIGQWPGLSLYSRRQIPFIRSSTWSMNVGTRRFNKVSIHIL